MLEKKGKKMHKPEHRASNIEHRNLISAIVAVAKNGVIGKEGGMPWHLPAEQARFKQLTMGHPIIMGRKTHESIGRALPGRTNIVITRTSDYMVEDCIVVNSLDDALKIAKTREGANEIFIIGGEQIYKQALPLLDRIYLTKVNTEVEGDRFFQYHQKEWKQVSSEKHPANAKNRYGFEFTILERVM